MELVRNAELFAKEKLSGIVRNDGKISCYKHLDDVVNRLKSLGVVDEEILCSGWLHDTIEQTDVIFDDLYERFGSRVAVLVSDLTPDVTLSKKKREQEYVRQLKYSSSDSKVIKLCDISANLSDLKNYDMSKSKKLRLVRQQRRYLFAVKSDLLGNVHYPKIQTLLESIDQILNRFVQRPSKIKSKY
ncbi:MAG: HD domain-containing protein [Nitrosopumilus sp.]|nr:MAG: HD domain-containing protein [Nitrosopumilus sp.]